MPPTPWSRLLQRAPAVGVALLLALEVGAAGEAPLDRLDAAMLSIGGQVRNAQMRLRKGFADVGPEGSNAPASVAAQCCQSNVGTIRERLQAVDGILKELRSYYGEHRNARGLGYVEQMSAQWRTLVQGMIHFTRATEEQKASLALQGLTQPWNELRNQANALRDCCAVPAFTGLGTSPQESTPPPGN